MIPDQVPRHRPPIFQQPFHSPNNYHRNPSLSAFSTSLLHRNLCCFIKKQNLFSVETTAQNHWKQATMGKQKYCKNKKHHQKCKKPQHWIWKSNWREWRGAAQCKVWKVDRNRSHFWSRLFSSSHFLSETGSHFRLASKSQRTLLPQIPQGLDNSCEPPQIAFLFDM